MTRKAKTYDANGNLIDSEIVPDGGVVRVRMTMMDHQMLPYHVQRILDENTVADTCILHKPGFLPVNAAARRDALEKKLDARDAKLSEAWRDPPKLDQTHEKPTPTPALDREAVYQRRDQRLRRAWEDVA
ncbi:hypothetical protein [Bradyrhizobium sp. URHD0069]|uniref:hypothetical protein n=1 Tax=Bradyrhizobium sp. URHD0069 TaxID=1380355 RepID=UPI000494F4F2|nr:hypothetical protein [Bradyrhizobium sp. URHD0069]